MKTDLNISDFVNEKRIKGVKQVLVATPAYSGLIYNTFVESLLGVMNVLPSIGWQLTFVSMGNESLISRGRNKLATMAYKNNFDKIFFIDADIQFTPEDFITVLIDDSPVSSGLTPLKSPQLDLVWNFIELPNEKVKNNRLKVKNVGTSFMAIDYSTLHTLVTNGKARKYIERGQEQYDFFPVGFSEVESNTYHSEDYLFCEKVRMSNLDVVVYPNVQLRHMGTFCFDPIILDQIQMLKNSYLEKQAQAEVLSFNNLDKYKK